MFDYAGQMTSAEAMKTLTEDPDTVLIDVRTMPEWNFVGVPNLSSIGKEVVTISWQEFPTMQVNGAFVEQVQSAGIAPTNKVLLLCRSGARSHAAATALAQAGFKDCHNVTDGFEGDKDENGHRNTISGWRASGCPWFQG